MTVLSKILLIGFIIYAVVILGLLGLGVLASQNLDLLSLEAALFIFFGGFPICSIILAISHMKLRKRAQKTNLPETFS